MMHYVGVQKRAKNPVKRVLLKNFTIRGLLDKMLRKTIKRNTWIYVSVSAITPINRKPLTDRLCRIGIVSQLTVNGA